MWRGRGKSALESALFIKMEEGAAMARLAASRHETIDQLSVHVGPGAEKGTRYG